MHSLVFHELYRDVQQLLGNVPLTLTLASDAEN
jgi:hypothetical protein